jgi:magnesium transporter
MVVASARLDSTAAGIMSRGFVAVHEDVTVAEVIQRLPTEEHGAHTAVIYVVDDHHCLLNVVPLLELLDVERLMPMKLMPKAHVFSVSVDTDHGTVARIVRKYHLLVVPVIDRRGRLVGSITAHDVMRILQAPKNLRQRARLHAVRTRPTRLHDVWSQRVVRWMIVLRLRFRRR